MCGFPYSLSSHIIIYLYSNKVLYCIIFLLYIKCNYTGSGFKGKGYRNDINKKVKTIVKNYNPEKIILFGSYADGNPTPESDVDLLIITDSDKSNWEVSIDISLLWKHSFPIDIIVKTPDELKKRIKMGDFFLKNILKNGKLLYERTR